MTPSRPHTRRSHRAAPLAGALALIAGLALALSASPAHADKATPKKAPKMDFTVSTVALGSVQVDGFVTDWEGVPKRETRVLTRGQPEYDWTGPRDASMLIQALHDSKMLYLAIEVRDNIVTKPKGRKGGDMVEVWFDAGPLAPKGKRLRMIALNPAKMVDGELPTASWGWPRNMKGLPKGMKVDGALREKGYFFEVGIPLDQLSDPPPGLEPIGMGIIARDWDYDDPNEDQAAVATSPFDAKRTRRPDDLGRLKLDLAKSIKDAFYHNVPAALGKPVIGAQLADVGGDARREWVFLCDNRYLVASGYGLGKGALYWFDLQRGPEVRYQSLEMRDVTGDGKDDFVVRYTVSHSTPKGTVTQALFAVFRYTNDTMEMSLLQEVGIKAPSWSIVNDVAIKPSRRGPASIVVGPAKVTGSVDEFSFIDLSGGGKTLYHPIVAPWDKGKRRTFTWGGSSFKRNDS